mgnify:FL=1
MGMIRLILGFFRSFFLSRTALVAENLALRQQLAVLQVSVKRPRLRTCDRLFWVCQSRFWAGWRSCLMVVKPETVIHWHRQGFKLYWRWKSRNKVGRPRVIAEICALVRRMAQENPTWGAPRIQSELALLGYTVAESTVAKYMSRAHKPPSQTWRTFLENHVGDIAAIDFLVVPTVRFRLCQAHLGLVMGTKPRRYKLGDVRETE